MRDYQKISALWTRSGKPKGGGGGGRGGGCGIGKPLLYSC